MISSIWMLSDRTNALYESNSNSSWYLLVGYQLTKGNHLFSHIDIKYLNDIWLYKCLIFICKFMWSSYYLIDGKQWEGLRIRHPLNIFGVSRPRNTWSFLPILDHTLWSTLRPIYSKFWAALSTSQFENTSSLPLQPTSLIWRLSNHSMCLCLIFYSFKSTPKTIKKHYQPLNGCPFTQTKPCQSPFFWESQPTYINKFFLDHCSSYIIFFIQSQSIIPSQLSMCLLKLCLFLSCCILVLIHVKWILKTPLITCVSSSSVIF